MLAELFSKLFPQWRHDSSRDTVKRRLHLVLKHDRIDLTPSMVEQMQQEILNVISRYVEVDTDSLEFSLANTQRTTSLVANVPIRRVRSDLEREEPSGEGSAQFLEELVANELEQRTREGSVAQVEVIEESANLDASRPSPSSES